MTRYPYGIGASFGLGASIVGLVYAVASVYVFGFIERAWGAGGSIQVVALMAVAMSFVSAVAFGGTLFMLGPPNQLRANAKPRAVAAAFGALCLVVAGAVTFALSAVGTLSLALAVFCGCGVVAAVVYRYKYSVPKHAAS